MNQSNSEVAIHIPSLQYRTHGKRLMASFVLMPDALKVGVVGLYYLLFTVGIDSVKAAQSSALAMQLISNLLFWTIVAAATPCFAAIYYFSPCTAKERVEVSRLIGLYPAIKMAVTAIHSNKLFVARADYHAFKRMERALRRG